MNKINKGKLTNFLIIFIIFTIISHYLYNNYNLDLLNNLKEEIKFFAFENIVLFVVIFLTLNIIFINSPIPLIAIVQILTGFILGFYLGFLFNIIGTFFACISGFLISRYFLRKTILNLLNHRLDKFEKELNKNGIYYIIGARILPIVPYFLINYLSGLTKYSLKKYSIATIIAIIPTALIYSYLGSNLTDLNNIVNILDYKIFLINLILVLISQIPLIIKKIKN